MVQDADGRFWVVGRYRNAGDSRTGLGAGERGLELAVFCSTDQGRSFDQTFAWSKSDLNEGQRAVVSIEGSALHWTEKGVELFVSTEQTGIGYPEDFEAFLKPGTGVWVIQRLAAATIAELPSAPVETILESRDPNRLHVKDPAVYDAPDGTTVLLFCTHPFCWSSSNTAWARRPSGSDHFDEPIWDAFPRGPAWDVAITRGTALWDVPRLGPFQKRSATVLFYDGGESLRNLDEHERALRRPRGYSCEELGGAACFFDGDMRRIERLSAHLPLFVSPYGTGCSRYVDVLAVDEGFYVTWQQSQADGSQPLVMNFVGMRELAAVLGA